MQNLSQSPLMVVGGDTSPINLLDDFELVSISSKRKNSDGDNTARRRKFRSQDFTERLYMWNDYLVKKFEQKQL